MLSAKIQLCRIVHFALGHTNFEHLLPVYVLITATVITPRCPPAT
jgi:hypothetical protein